MSDVSPTYNRGELRAPLLSPHLSRRPPANRGMKWCGQKRVIPWGRLSCRWHDKAQLPVECR